MISKPLIAFVCNEINYVLQNRKSAIDSILCSILEGLSDQYDIEVNGAKFKPSRALPMNNQQDGKSLIGSIKKKVPQGIKERIKLKKLLNNSDKLVNEIVEKSSKPDLVIELYKLGSSLGKKLSEHYGCPYLIYYDSPVVEQYEDIWKRKVHRREEFVERQRSSASSANAIIAYSKPVEDYLTKMGCTCPVHIYQTLDYTRLTQVKKIQEEGITIGFIGSFMPWHRVDLLLNSFIRLKKEGHNGLKLLLIGSGEDFEKTQAQIESEGLSNCVEMPGFVDGKELQVYKSRIDIGIMPGSNWYGIPTKVFEYGACKIASLAPNTPTIADIFCDGKDIQLFEWDNAESFYQKLKQLVEDEIYRQNIALGLKSTINERYSLEIAKGFYTKIINELII